MYAQTKIVLRDGHTGLNYRGSCMVEQEMRRLTKKIFGISLPFLIDLWKS
jgi:hypothetical protein